MSDDEADLRPDPSVRNKRWVSFFLFAAFYVIVCSALVALFIFFTHSWVLAIVLVGFMVAYMSVMGWIAMRREKDLDL